MKPRSLLPVALALAGAAGLSLYLLQSPPAPVTATPGSAPAEADRARSSARAPIGAGPTLPPSQAPAAGPADEGRPPVSVGRSNVVATVNGVSLTGANLLPFGAKEGDEQAISAPMYEFLRQRAIDRELTIQAARKEGVDLTATQREQLKQVRANAVSRGESDPARLEFEENEARAALLVRTLAEKFGAPPPLAGDADVDRHLEKNAGKYGPLPTDPAALQKIRIEVRQALYDEFQKRHQEGVREYLDRLAAESRITN